MSSPKKKFNPFGLVLVFIYIMFAINPFLGLISLIFLIYIIFSKSKNQKSFFGKYIEVISEIEEKFDNRSKLLSSSSLETPSLVKTPQSLLLNFTAPKKLERKKKYLHIALNSSLEEAREIISVLPASDRILIEAGTPLIKIHGTRAIQKIKLWSPLGAYIVADNKCADLANREVRLMAEAGASAATCLGIAPIETINNFIEECKKFNLDSMLDMMNVEDALSVLKKLKKPPTVVILHRGVDETEFSKEKQIPYYQIKQIKGHYNILVAVAGGDTIKEVQRAIFNDADIVVVWKNFYEPSEETASLAESFLKEIK